MNVIIQNEMAELITGLHNRGIEFTVRSVCNGLQVVCDSWDAICHNGSYGHEYGLIEVMGLPQCNDGVLGYLTAQDVLEMVDSINESEGK